MGEDLLSSPSYLLRHSSLMGVCSLRPSENSNSTTGLSWVLASFARPSHPRESWNPLRKPLKMCCPRTGFPLSRE